jgi:hypothetical protein
MERVRRDGRWIEGSVRETLVASEVTRMVVTSGVGGAVALLVTIGPPRR